MATHCIIHCHQTIIGHKYYAFLLRAIFTLHKTGASLSKHWQDVHPPSRWHQRTVYPTCFSQFQTYVHTYIEVVMRQASQLGYSPNNIASTKCKEDKQCCGGAWILVVHQKHFDQHCHSNSRVLCWMRGKRRNRRTPVWHST